MKSTLGIPELIQAIAAIVQQQGQHDFPSYHLEDNVRSASLCGLSVYIANGHVLRVKARDMEIVLDDLTAKAANDEKTRPIASHSYYSFAQGSLIELERWYNRLTRIQSVFRLSPYVANDRETA